MQSARRLTGEGWREGEERSVGEEEREKRERAKGSPVIDSLRFIVRPVKAFLVLSGYSAFQNRLTLSRSSGSYSGRKSCDISRLCQCSFDRGVYPREEGGKKKTPRAIYPFAIAETLINRWGLILIVVRFTNARDRVEEKFDKIHFRSVLSSPGRAN